MNAEEILASVPSPKIQQAASDRLLRLDDLLAQVQWDYELAKANPYLSAEQRETQLERAKSNALSLNWEKDEIQARLDGVKAALRGEKKNDG